MPRSISVAQAAVLCVVLITAVVAQTSTTSLDKCHDDLDELRKAASEASESAGHAKSQRDHLDDCREHPETYDLIHDRCRSLGSDNESALNDLEGKIDDVDSKLRSVQDSCDYQFTINKLTALEATQRRLEASQRRLCASLRKLVESGLPRDAALQLCKPSMNEQWCGWCLDSR